MNRYQTAAELNGDEAFLSLLSSQRELLCQLNRENAANRRATNECQNQAAFGGSGSGSGMMPATAEQQFHQQYNHKDPFVPPNHSIYEPLMSENMVYSKGFSMGLGNDIIVTPSNNNNCEVDENTTKLCGFDSSCDLPSASALSGKKRDKDDYLGSSSSSIDELMAGKKRRLSCSGFFHSIFFDDFQPQQCQQQQQQQQETQRRLSLSSMTDRLQLPGCFSDNFSDDEDLYQGFDSLVEVPINNYSLPVPQQQQQQQAPLVQTTQHQQPPSAKQPTTTTTILDPKEARQTMVSLSAAMEKSQKSQQDIHDWDRKMGLKRSHSKTMRLSTRSRKKLRAMLKKQINALSPKKR